MDFFKEALTKDNRPLILRSGTEADGKEFLRYFEAAHGETDFLLTYPDESSHDTAEMARRLEEKRLSPISLEICAFVDGRLAGSAGFEQILDRVKTRHRAEFGISVLKDYWGLGIGEALTRACIDAAAEAGFLQLELDVVAGNLPAVSLYRKLGFVEYGRNPRAFRLRQGGWQELILMRLELQELR